MTLVKLVKIISKNLNFLGYSRNTYANILNLYTEWKGICKICITCYRVLFVQ